MIDWINLSVSDVISVVDTFRGAIEIVFAVYDILPGT